MTGIGRGALRMVATDARSQDGSRAISSSQVADGSPQRARAADGRRDGGHHGRGRDRSACASSRGSAGSSSLWFHVDAAWGGAAILSPALRRLSRRHRRRRLDHLRRAQVVLRADGRRDVLLPASRVVGEAFRAQDRRTCRRQSDGLRRRSVHTSVQWSRRFIGLKLFLALAERGESGYAAMIEHQARMGDLLRESARSARAGGSSTARRCRWCASPATASSPSEFLVGALPSVRSRGCRKSGSATSRRSCAPRITSFRTTASPTSSGSSRR